MTETDQPKKKGRAYGCGIVLIFGIVAVIIVGTMVGRPIREAKRTEQKLNDDLGMATAFTPVPDGSVAPQRIEAFLRVRARAFAHCGGFQDVLDDVLSLEQVDDEEKQPGAGTFLQSIMNFKGLFGIGPKFLDFVTDRNTALLAEQMGLGEYIYIYVLAYSEELSRADSKYAEMEEARISERTTRELAAILGNQLTALDAAAKTVETEELAIALREQIDLLEDGSQSIPWQSAHPAVIADSFEPFADRLSALYCPGIVKIELLQKNKGLELEG